MILYRLLAVLGRPLVRVVCRSRVQGREHVPATGGFVLGATHLSGFDVLAIAAPLAPRPLRYMAKKQLFARPLLGPLVRGLGAFPALGGNGGEGGVAVATELARAGQAVVIFPEGGRRRLDDEHRARTGAARVALAADVPLVPAALRGTDGWRRLRRWHVVFGPPIPLEDLRAREAAAAAREATRRLSGAITALEAELDRC